MRRLIAAEALIVSLVAGALGLLAGRPLADALARVLADHGAVPRLRAGSSWIPLVGRARPRRRDRAARRRRRRLPRRPHAARRRAQRGRDRAPRPGVVRVLTGAARRSAAASPWRRVRRHLGAAFAILGGILLAIGIGLLGRWLLGLPGRRARLAAAAARRARAAGEHGLAANRWRTAALATPIVLIAMLAGTRASCRPATSDHTERVTAARVTAGHVVAGRAGAPLPAGTARRSPASRA